MTTLKILIFITMRNQKKKKKKNSNVCDSYKNGCVNEVL